METEIKEGRKEEGQAEPGSVNGLLGPFHEPPLCKSGVLVRDGGEGQGGGKQER